MDDGLIQFLVIAFFVIVTMMDGAARKRRKQAQSSEHLPESLPQTREEIAAWSAEDDLGEAAESPGVRMELKDVWEEIATLARGEVPGREADPVRGPATVDADAILHEKHTEVAVPAAERASPRSETEGSALGGQGWCQELPPGGHHSGRGAESSGGTTRPGLEASVLAPHGLHLAGGDPPKYRVQDAAVSVVLDVHR